MQELGAPSALPSPAWDLPARGRGCSTALFLNGHRLLPHVGVLCMPSCVRDGVGEGLSWQHSHVNCGPNPHPSCKHQRGCYSSWVRATLWTLLLFLCIVTGIERSLFIDELNPQYSHFRFQKFRLHLKMGVNSSDLMDFSPPSSSIQGILLTRTLEWFPFPPRGIFPTRDQTWVCCDTGGLFTC